MPEIKAAAAKRNDILKTVITSGPSFKKFIMLAINLNSKITFGFVSTAKKGITKPIVIISAIAEKNERIMRNTNCFFLRNDMNDHRCFKLARDFPNVGIMISYG